MNEELVKRGSLIIVHSLVVVVKGNDDMAETKKTFRYPKATQVELFVFTM